MNTFLHCFFQYDVSAAHYESSDRCQSSMRSRVDLSQYLQCCTQTVTVILSSSGHGPCRLSPSSPLGRLVCQLYARPCCGTIVLSDRSLYCRVLGALLDKGSPNGTCCPRCVRLFELTYKINDWSGGFSSARFVYSRSSSVSDGEELDSITVMQFTGILTRLPF